ncbi:transposase [Rhodovulum sulfidophilum]|uniref:Transposase n=1 Tax=Rhodovulum sulfidophilum TaxID=35806 RepID=A0ABS1RXG4_RHOSU|nr:transposase [Rhodovulum sulfidophilum]MBL3609654.1 transposase [Rhodovulum sulfidophilum]
MRRLVRASDDCRRPMTIPGGGPLAALAFRVAIDDPFRFRRARDFGGWLRLVSRRYRSGEGLLRYWALRLSSPFHRRFQAPTSISALPRAEQRFMNEPCRAIGPSDNGE